MIAAFANVGREEGALLIFGQIELEHRACQVVCRIDQVQFSTREIVVLEVDFAKLAVNPEPLGAIHFAIEQRRTRADQAF